ncbi:MAG: histidine kinase [Caldilineaceae bacterium]
MLAIIGERERLARELHDDLGQVFAFVSAQGQTARLLLARASRRGRRTVGAPRPSRP